MQFSSPQIQFTQLSNYQSNPQTAQPCLTITHYTDIHDKDVVLMRGEIDLSVIESSQGQRLVYLLQLFYGDEKKFDIVERFNKGGEFDYNEIIKASDVLA